MIKNFRSLYLFLLIFSFLVSCSISTPLPTLLYKDVTQTSLQITATEVFIKPQVTHTPPMVTQAPIKTSATGTPASPPDVVMKYIPFNLVSSIPVDKKPTGILVISGETPLLLHFGTEIWKETLSENSCLSTSPNGKWLAYCPLSKDSHAGRWLTVESYNRQQKITVPMDTHLLFFDTYLWLDNQRLIFPLITGTDAVRPYPMVVINPFNSEKIELSSNYPGLKLFDISPAPMQFNYSDVVYDSSLNLVVYPEWGKQIYYTLWDRQKKIVLAKVEDQGILGHYPLWTSDGKQFAVAVNYEDGDQHDKFIEEWFSVNREGRVERITQFGDYFTHAEIGAANWSPDGQKLAFWLETRPGMCTGERLAILDILTKQVINTCVPGSFRGDAPPPVWSFDSGYIVVRNVEEELTRVIIVDIEQSWAFQIPGVEYGQPVGWLISEP